MAFEKITQAADDPILGLAAKFRNDPRPQKVDLGVGVYYNQDGKVDLFPSVAQAEAEIVSLKNSKNYLPMVGHQKFLQGIKQLILGANNPKADQVDLIQTLAGTGALGLGAALLKHQTAVKTIWVSDITWGNHHSIFSYPGLEIKTYGYYNPQSNSFDLEACLASLSQAQPGEAILLQACCHNPTGVDPSLEQWQEILKIVKEKQLVVFFDSAYLGLANSLDQDLAAIRLFISEVDELLIAFSCSKIFGLYGERTGALLVLSKTKEQAQAAVSQAALIARGFYSMPPLHGAQIVAEILANPQTAANWSKEVVAITTRIKELRKQLVDGLAKHGLDFSFINHQYGLFSYSGLTPQQAQTLIDDYAIYLVKSGRINVSGLNQNNIQYVIDAIAKVVKGS